MNDKFDLEEWYDKNIDLYKSLAANVANTLKTALDKNNIAYVSIPYRAKTKESFLKKWEEKQYDDVEKMMDIAGIRVITLVESDLEPVEDLIKQLFNVHEKDSENKDHKLGEDKFGYRSRHFVCDIGKAREKLIELEHFKNKKFEIQIRTALAHAWAEIEHDRGYKLEGGLPVDIKRRLNIVAALLESADNEFNRLTIDIEKYKESINQKLQENYLNLPINSTTLFEYLDKNFINLFENKENEFNNDNIFNRALEDLKTFNINTIDELDKLINNIIQENTEILDMKFIKQSGFITFMLCIENLEKFFENTVWKIKTISEEKLSLLYRKYGEERVNKIIESHNPEILHNLK